jgi:hypothetical protein
MSSVPSVEPPSTMMYSISAPAGQSNKQSNSY